MNIVRHFVLRSEKKFVSSFVNNVCLFNKSKNHRPFAQVHTLQVGAIAFELYTTTIIYTDVKWNKWANNWECR